jgi:hypothetical protein
MLKLKFHCDNCHRNSIVDESTIDLEVKIDNGKTKVAIAAKCGNCGKSIIAFLPAKVVTDFTRPTYLGQSEFEASDLK